MKIFTLRSALVASALSVWVSLASAQGNNNPALHPTIRGTVHDAVTHRAMPRVIVTLEEESSGYAGQAETDTSGNFSFQGLPPGMFIVRVRFPGYQEVSEHLDLTVV